MLENLREQYFFRTGLLVGLSTLVLTAAFVGILALLRGAVAGFDARVPWYLVVSALVFTVTILFLERHDSDGQVIITTALVVTLVSLITVTLSYEGVLFAVYYPEDIFVSQLVLYFLAASLLSSGLGYWGLKHWREFTESDRGSASSGL